MGAGGVGGVGRVGGVGGVGGSLGRSGSGGVGGLGGGGGLGGSGGSPGAPYTLDPEANRLSARIRRRMSPAWSTNFGLSIGGEERSGSLLGAGFRATSQSNGSSGDGAGRFNIAGGTGTPTAGDGAGRPGADLGGSRSSCSPVEEGSSSTSGGRRGAVDGTTRARPTTLAAAVVDPRASSTSAAFGCPGMTADSATPAPSG
jgi:hypothetical protein